jgi:integrase
MARRGGVDLATVRNKPTKSGKYQALYVDHRGKRRTVTMQTKSKALKVANLKEAEGEEIRLGIRSVPRAIDQHVDRPTDEVIQEYLDWGNAQGGRRGRPWGVVHARNRKSHLTWWRQELRLAELGDLAGILPRVEKALQRLLKIGRTGKTVSNYAEALRAFCLWCQERRYLPEDPLKGLAAFDTTPLSQRRAMTKEEARRLLSSCAPHRRLLYEMAIYSGLRANELRSLTASDLDVENSGVHLRAAWTKNRKDGFQPLPKSLVTRLSTFAQTDEALRMYVRLQNRSGATKPYPADPLLHVPSHTARAIDVDLEAAGIEKWTSKGKLDFHAIRVAFVNFVFDSNATVKEAQTLARHASPELTMNVYGRTRSERLSQVVEDVAEELKLGLECVPAVYQQAVGSELKNATPFITRELRSSKMVEAAGIEPASEIKSTKTYYVRSRSLESRPLRCQSTVPRFGTSSVKSRPPPLSMSLGQPAKDVIRIRRAGSTDPNELPNYLGGQRVRLSIVVYGFYHGLTRKPDPSARSPSFSNPVEARSPPISNLECSLVHAAEYIRRLLQCQN